MRTRTLTGQEPIAETPRAALPGLCILGHRPWISHCGNSSPFFTQTSLVTPLCPSLSQILCHLWWSRFPQTLPVTGSLLYSSSLALRLNRDGEASPVSVFFPSGCGFTVRPPCTEGRCPRVNLVLMLICPHRPHSWIQ